MTTTMIIHATKLHKPRPRTNWIARPRLLALLDRSRAEEQRLLLVSAPAGAGKTTLVSHWLAGQAAPAAWLSLDAEDDEPIRFWTCVIYALQTVVPGLGDEFLAMLTSPAPPPLAALLPALLNVVTTEAAPIVLVLDDYHLVTNQAIHDSVTAAVERMPAGMRLVLSTRADPPLPLARWRARGELIEVRGADLRFTSGEAVTLLNQRMALNLPGSDVEELLRRTEGWAVGLQLAGISLQGVADPHAAIRALAGTRQYMLDYLLEEVLARQPPPIQRFLLTTSILARMCGSLCDALAGADAAPTGFGAAMLQELQRQNLFLVPLDEERVWFRYHHLFGELLRARLLQVTPAELPLLHLRASRWYEQRNATSEAVEHALAAEAWDRAAQLLEAHEEDWWTGADVTVMNLLPSLPDEVVRRGPNLSVYKAWFLLIRGQLAAAAALLARAEYTLAHVPPTAAQRSLASFVTLQQAYIAEITGAPDIVRHPFASDGQAAGQAASLASSLADIPEDRGGMRNSAEVILAYVLYRSGDFTAAEGLLLATIKRDRRTGATNGIPISASRLARMWVAAGRLAEAAALCQQCAALVDERGKWRFFVAGNLGIVYGEILREWNRLDEAQAAIRGGIADNELWQVAHAYALGYSALARLLLARGDVAGAAAELDRQAQLTGGRTLPPDLAAETRAVQLRLAVAAGDYAAIDAFAATWAPQAAQAGHFRGEQDLLSLARAWLARGHAAQAAELLAQLAAGATAGKRMRRLAEILVLSALAEWAQGRHREARESAARALATAEAMGCIRVFVDEGSRMKHLIAAAARMLPAHLHPFAAKVIDAFDDAGTAAHAAPARPLAPRADAGDPPIESLTPREREVLFLLATGCSNRDIAAQLTITLHAVKKHTGNIYAKLGAANRTHALILAQELGILPR